MKAELVLLFSYFLCIVFSLEEFSSIRVGFRMDHFNVSFTNVPTVEICLMRCMQMVTSCVLVSFSKLHQICQIADRLLPLVEDQKYLSIEKVLAVTLVSSDNQLIIVPKKESCDVDEGEPVKFVKSSKLTNEDIVRFSFDVNRGTLTHVCSKRALCIRNQEIVLSEKCEEDLSNQFIMRTIFSTITFGWYCVRKMSEEKRIFVEGKCSMSELQYGIKIQNIEPARAVFMEFFKTGGQLQFADIDNKTPLYSGYLDKMMFLGYIQDLDFQVRLQSYFYPPASKNYIFSVTQDDDSELWINEIDALNNILEKRRIIKDNGHTGRRSNFGKVVSSPIYLNHGQKYHLEARLLETHGDNYIVVAMEKDDRSGFETIPLEYLQFHKP